MTNSFAVAWLRMLLDVARSWSPPANSRGPTGKVRERTGARLSRRASLKALKPAGTKLARKAEKGQLGVRNITNAGL